MYMAVPTVTWRKHESSSDTTGSEISTLNYSTVDAGSWSSAQCVRAHLSASSTTTVSSVRFWLYDQTAKITSTNTTLKDGSKPWSFVGTHQAALSSKNFGLCSADYGTLMPYFDDGGTYSLGSGYALPTVTTPGYTDYVWVGAKPNVSASSGWYSAFGYQLGYSY
jgi:hypothetical protein